MPKIHRFYLPSPSVPQEVLRGISESIHFLSLWPHCFCLQEVICHCKGSFALCEVLTTLPCCPAVQVLPLLILPLVLWGLFYPEPRISFRKIINTALWMNSFCKRDQNQSAMLSMDTNSTLQSLFFFKLW